MRWEDARKRVLRQDARERLAAPIAKPPPVRVTPPTSRPSPGALLTGNVRGDFWLGALNEPVAIALAAFGAFQLLSAPVYFSFLVALGQIGNGAFMLWHGVRMRERFPTVVDGFKRWRGISGWWCNHVVTLLCGALLTMALFPIVGFMLLFIQMFGDIGWIPVLIAVYALGFVARRIRGDGKSPRRRIVNG